jgi:8-oxo-dGTP pyrophosphatase MutT (NUDIX family)
MEESNGIFIFDKTKQMLICRPTGIKGQTGWTIPKGKTEGSESHKDAALRETWEETGLDLKEFKKDLVELPSKRYKTRRKRLFGFVLTLNRKIDISELKCDCKITGKDRPEIDKYEMVDAQDAIERLHECQGRMLEDYYTGEHHDD